jgi:hypothetical protein
MGAAWFWFVAFLVMSPTVKMLIIEINRPAEACFDTALRELKCAPSDQEISSTARTYLASNLT